MSNYYPNVPFHSLILKNFDRFAGNVALVHDKESVTFEQLSELVLKMEEHLKVLGIGTNDTVLVALPNSILYPVIFLACAKIGAIMSGVSHTSTEHELRYYLAESGAKWVFVISETNLDWIKEEAKLYVIPQNLEMFHSSNDSAGSYEEEPKIDIDAVLLAPFSSGTTGAPKCCLLTHRNFLASTFALKQFIFNELLSKSSQKTLAFLPFHHASGFWALLLCLLEGCTTYIMSEFHPVVMIDLIEEFHIDTINIVPSIANALLRMKGLHGRCPSLRTVLCGSGGFSKDKCKEFLAIFPQVTNFLQGYGMTEMVVLSHITPYSDKLQHLGSCGNLLPGFEQKFLSDEFGTQELLLKSDAIMKKYKNGTENLDENGFLHTGDVAVEHEHFCYIVDRKKDLIKVNGFQVSPTEIESLIQTLPNVVEVAVVGIEDELCGQLPRAFIVLEQNTDELLFLKHLEHLMKEKLSAIKQLRGGINIIKEMPKSLNGKIKRSKLQIN